MLFVMAACCAQADPGTALRFNGTNGYVSVPHAAALDAFPLTITAWIRTARTAALYDGVATKYSPGSGNGYSLHVYNGRLRAWYFSPTSSVYPGDPGLDGGVIADGQWHHVALVVSANNGTIYIDGVSRGTPVAWSGTPAPPTTTIPMLIGRYSTNAGYASSFAGDIDEVGIWNRALGTGELNYLKHLRLTGSEDGLVSLWHLDEGLGPTSVDATPAARVASLNGPVAWVPSAAPIALSMIATNCLRFDGVNGYVQVPHNTDLNAYPLTASAWFRTTNGAAVVQGIVSKYQDASANGWTLVVQNGRLRGFYYRSFSNFALDAFPGTSVADGAWHHAAMTVDATGGKLYLDGVLVGSGTWASGGSASTSAEPLLIGRYYNYANRFLGALDEITVWNRALTGTEIQSLKNLPLAGNETGLVAYWRLDEGLGTTAADATGHGYDGSLISSPAWTGSTALLGDGSVHLAAATDIPFNQQLFAMNGAYLADKFGIKANATFWRFYDFSNAPPNSTVSFKFDAGLRIASSGAPVSVKSNTYTFTFSMAAYNASSPLFTATINQSMNLEPQTGVQLDSINNLHQMTATLAHNENGGAFSTDGTEATDTTRLLHFNGHVMFGNIDIVVSNLINTPVAGTVVAPSYVQSQLQIGPNGAYFAAAPTVRFGGGAAFTVNLGVDGTATNVNGSFSFSAAGQFFETNGIRYRMPGLALNAAGLVASNLEAWFPTGVGMTTSTNVRAMLPYVSKTNVTIGPDLLPTNSTVIFTAASYNTNRLYFAEETKPFLIGALQIEWRIPQGEFFMSEAQTLLFVREQDDRDLSNAAGTLIDPSAADRISNDTYYRHVAAVPATPIYIRPNPNGAALLTMQATLQTNEYRPHFPYIARNIGGHIPVVGGALVITNDLIDSASSYLLLAGPAPLPYARDCSPEAGCVGFPTVGAQVLNFTALPGHLGLGEFTFTPEGGLLAYGAIPAANLTWGFLNGANYAQRTSDVTSGAYYISGTFLHAEDFAGDQEARRSVRMLFSGYGTNSGVTYVERPGQANYADGFANYAGLNFRAPAQGRSFLAGQDTGLYPLTARSKYYLRSGGVSGIHESATFPANMTLYGYAFAFSSYRLSYLDSDNWESRTDGSVALPVPSGFPVEFERMKFLCRGNLDSAQLPANIGIKHLVYWNTDLKPLSLQFRPRTNNACSLSERYLVLGVETKLPFIPQAFHAALAFKNNGNLANVATGVEGVDSRFAVPANLSLQGPGGSFYPFTAAAEGYFNNWETAGRPNAGFYSLVGRIRVPFFRDIKSQLHITPTSPTTAQINLIGGWAAESGLGQNRGWNIGTQNYFNTAKFDPTHDGWQPGVALADYRQGDENFRPRAQQNWIDVAIFDYPLAWNSVLREFSGFADAKVILPVIDVDSRLKELSPGKVDFDFAQDINLQLPRIKVLDFANDALNELNAPINTISNAIRKELTSALSTAGLTSGFRSLQNVLRENAEGFFRPVLQPALDPVVDNIYNALAPLAANKALLVANAPGIVMSGANGLQTAIQNLNGTAAQGNKVLGQLNQTLNDADDTLGLFLRVLEKDGSGNRHVVRTIIQKLAEDQGPAIGLVADLGDGLVNGLLTDLEPTLAKIEADMRQLQSQFNDLRTQVLAGTGDLNAALNAANHDSAALSTYLGQAGAGVANLMSSVVGPAGDYFTADPARAKREIRERLIVTFLGSSVLGKYQQTFRQFMYDKNFLLNQLMDVLFDQVNRSIRNGLNIAGAQDGLFKGLKGAGAMTGSLLSAKIRGAPTFEGDSLREIHLDSEIKMNLPDEMKFSAYMDIKELNSQSTALSCIPEGAPAAEVTLGARDIPLDWLGASPLTLSIEARWTLQSGAVLGVGGSLEVKGKVGFKGGSLNDFGASLAIGQVENYFAAKAGATVVILGIPVNFTAGIFAGHCCSLDPLLWVDPDAASVLIVNVSDFTGVYLAFGGGVSLSDILFGTSSCLLDVSATVNYALYYQGGVFLGSIGGSEKITVEADLICIISASASWGVAMRLDSVGRLTMVGEARLCGKVGWCPACLKACKTLKITGVVDTGGVDYDIDF